ncbi:MAG: hypothetical protein OXR66_06125 [Candidatus Woesearchaeota archaeon]|nr:hypothetical protein [Candidatus Woesearchaeota archaeon]
MHTDLVFPKGNESKLVAMAVKLGFERLLCCYTLDDPYVQEREKELKKFAGIEVIFALYVENQQEVQKAKRFTKHIVARGKPGLFEDKRVQYVINFEAGKKKDFVHHRNSGLTQVFIKHGIRTKKTFLVNFNHLLHDDGTILGRIQQNNMFFKKYTPDVLVVSGASSPLEMRAPKDLENILQL